MEQVNKEREEREKLLAKIKHSIGENKEDKDKQTTEVTPELKKNNQEIDRNEIVETAKENIDFEKIKKAKSLYEVFDDEVYKKDRKRNQVRTRRTRGNINLGNVYNKIDR